MAFYQKTYNKKFGVWYPAAMTMGQPVPVKQVAKRLSAMCTATYADVMAVLGNLPDVMADYMAQGKSVRLDGLGTFRYTLDTRGVTDEAEFDFQKQVKAVRVQFVPQREGRSGFPTTPRCKTPPPTMTARAKAPARTTATTSWADAATSRRATSSSC